MDAPTSSANLPAGPLNLGGLQSLRSQAQKDPRSAVREAAKQFEAMFMQQILKSMRESAQSSSQLMGGDQESKMANEMLDGQWAQTLSGQAGGLADVIARQLDRQIGVNPALSPRPASANNYPVDPLQPNAPVAIPQKAAAAFVTQQTAAAQAAERASGIPATFMIAQAAHETGWGRHEIRNPDGSTSYNLFGMKAGPNWKGPTTDVTTTEYIGGQARKVTQTFRAYGSYAESFMDYARTVGSSPRYAGVVAAGHDAQRFAQGLQQAGYATDPNYAAKIVHMIAATERVQRAVNT